MLKNDFTKIKPRSPQDFIWKKVIKKIKRKKMRILFIILYLFVLLFLGFGFFILGFLFGLFINLCFL